MNKTSNTLFAVGGIYFVLITAWIFHDLAANPLNRFKQTHAAFYCLAPNHSQYGRCDSNRWTHAQDI